MDNRVSHLDAQRPPVPNVYSSDIIYFWSIKHQHIVKLTRSIFENVQNGFPCELCIPRYRPFMYGKPCQFVSNDFDQYKRHVINSENYYRRALVWTNLDEIPFNDLERNREIGDLKSLEKVPYLKIEYLGRTIVKRRREILDYFKMNGCHCKEHLGVQCRVKCDQFLSLFSHLKHLERENYKHCVFEATSTELELSELSESNAHQSFGFNNLAGHYRMPTNRFNSIIPDLAIQSGSIDNSNDSNGCPLAMVECVLGDQNEDRNKEQAEPEDRNEFGDLSADQNVFEDQNASENRNPSEDQSVELRPTVSDCRTISIYEEWRNVNADHMYTSDASKSARDLPAESLSNFSMYSVASSSSESHTRSRNFSHLYDGSKAELSYESFIRSEDEYEEEENDAWREEVGLRDLLVAGYSKQSQTNGSTTQTVRQAASGPCYDLYSVESKFDPPVPSLEDCDQEVVYRKLPIKREVQDSEEWNDISKKFKIDYEGCIVID